MAEPQTSPFDLEAEADAIETLRLDLRKAGPTSGISGQKAVDADALLARTRDFYRSISERRRSRLQQASQRGSLV